MIKKKKRPVTVSYQVTLDFLSAANNELDKMVMGVVTVIVVCVCVNVCVCVCITGGAIPAIRGHVFICLFKYCMLPSLHTQVTIPVARRLPSM